MSEAVANVVGSAVESQDAPLMESGLDSLGSVELRNSLASRFGIDLPATVTLDYPSISALAAYIASLLVPHSRPRRPQRGLKSRITAGEQSPIQIVGASCIYPGTIPAS